MRVLFCSDSMIVDGVTSFVFHLATALKEAGNEVAVLGRWAGKGFQPRLRSHGVEVIECLSPTVGNFWFDKKAAEFRPDVLVTDSRRSFPLAVRLKLVTGAKIFTFFLDRLEKTDRKGRDVASLIKYSDAWLSAEKPLLEELESIPTPFRKFHLQRPLKGLFTPTPIPPKDPFRILSFGRVSCFKSITSLWLLKNALYMKKEIPSLEMIFVGGGWRTLKYRMLAANNNLRAGAEFIKILGTQIDPQPWFEWANLVCAGSTSAIEAALSNRPVVASTGYYLGLLTPDKIEKAFSSYFSERSGPLLSENPHLLIEDILRIYREWDEIAVNQTTAAFKNEIEPFFERDNVALSFQNIYKEVLSGNC